MALRRRDARWSLHTVVEADLSQGRPAGRGTGPGEMHARALFGFLERALHFRQKNNVVIIVI